MNRFHIRYRRMTAADVPAVHALEMRCFSAPWDIDAYYSEMRNPTAYYVVAEAEEEIVGFGGMWAVADEAHIVTLATHPDARRRGIARRLMELLLAEARRRDILLVSLEVRVGNTPAKNLYTDLGFYTVARRPNYYPDNGEDAAVMVLRMAAG